MAKRSDWEDELRDVGAEVRGGMITLYHGTSLAKAVALVSEGVLRAPPGTSDTYGVYASTSCADAEAQGGSAVVKFTANLSDVEFEDYFPGRALWANIRTKRGVFKPVSVRRVRRCPAK